MAVCILKYLRTEMHSSPLPRMVNVVVIFFFNTFLEGKSKPKKPRIR